MDPQRLLTLPGYSWRRKRHEGEKRGWETTFILFCFLRSFFPLLRNRQVTKSQENEPPAQDAWKLDKKLRLPLKFLLS
jgi:hypothetical protein